MKKSIIAIILIALQLAFYAQSKRFIATADIFGERVFIKNNGQFNAVNPNGNIIYYGYEYGKEKVYFTQTGLIYLLEKKYDLTEHQKEAMEHGKKVEPKATERYLVNMTWENANSNILIEESEKQSWYHSYGDYKADCYKKIIYKNVYNNIDIEYVFPKDISLGIKYNVILNPGANVNDIKIKYSGDVKSISIKKGDIIIKTPLESIVEHKPVSFQNNQNVESNFSLSNDNIIGFNFPNGYNTNQILVIDPWVTNMTLATNNYAFDVDYDYAGNFFVYGGSGPFKVSKYSPAGVFIWTFAGTVASQGFPGGSSASYPANFLVDKVSGKTYVGDCPVGSGARMVRLDIGGLYDNFVTTVNAQWTELWDMGYNCGTGQVYGIGGSVASPGNVSAGIVNTTSGAMVPQNFSGLGTFAQDVVSHAFDPSGTLFFIFASLGGTPFLNNKIMRVNPAFNGNIWIQPSTYTSFSEAANKNNYVGIGLSSNGFNSLAANSSFLYYYDGFNLSAYNKLTGAKVGFTTIPGLSLRQQGGIAVDNCNNVYIGGNNSILSYNFNGTTFSALPSIPCGATSPNKFVYDIKLDEPSNLLYVSGSAFGGVYNAINSTTCTQVQLTVTPICVGNNNGTAIASLTTNLAAPLVTYSWTNSSGIVVSLTSTTTALTNTATNLANGNYTLYTQVNAPCGPVITQTFNINCVCSVTAVASSSCVSAGLSTTLNLGATAGFSTSPLTYSWAGPGGFTSNLANQTIATAVSGIYTLTVGSPACSSSGTVQVTTPSSFTPAIANTSVSCFNGSNGTANVSTITGISTAPYTYLWSSAQTTPLALGLIAGNYTCAVTDSKGCTYSGTTTIIQPAQAFLTLANTSVVCNGGANGTATVATIPIANTSPYTYTWSGSPTQTTSQALGLIAGTYSCSLTDNIGCVFTGTTTIIQPTSVSVTISTNTTQVCVGSIINFSASASGGNNSAYTYSWSTANIGSTTAISETNGGSYNYTVTALDANTCSANAVHTVTFIPNPILTCANKDLCNGSSTNLYVNGASNYSWSPSAGLNVTSGSAVIANPVVTTIYTILGNNSFCTGLTTVTVGVINYPNSVIFSPNQQICFGANTQITATGAQNYNWMPNYAISATTGASVVVSPSVNTTYTITSYNSSGTVICSETKQMPILVVPQVTPTISNNQLICAGQKVTLYAGGGNTFVWTPTVGLNQSNASGVVANPSLSTIYNVHVSNNEFCGNSATVSIIVNPNPTVFAGRDSTFNLDEPMFINASGTGTLTWISGEGIFCYVCPNTKITATYSGCYIIQTVNEFGCKASDEVCIDITTDYGVYLPNSFTPNDDGLNDMFLIFGYSISDVTMDIFDRWGEKLFSSNDQKLGWNGMYKGTSCKSDVYVYKVSYKGLDGKKHFKTGHVSISK